MNPKLPKKALLVLVLAALVAAFLALDLERYLSLSFIKDSQAGFRALSADNPVLVVGLYFLVYVAVTALSLPGAAVMTLLGGGLFGFWVGLLTVSFASSLGATLACFVARYLLRDWVQGRFGGKLAAVNRGIEEEGAFYLFSLRLIPIFPFFVINLVMGLTPIKLFTFYWVSQVGMLAGTAVYVNAGKELAKIDSLGGIVSPGLLASFVILGLFPITVKKVMGWYRKRSGRGARPAD